MIDEFLVEVSSAGKFIPAHCYSVLRAVWQQMIYDGDVGVTTNLIDNVKSPGKPDVEHDIWTVDQVKIFLKAVLASFNKLGMVKDFIRQIRNIRLFFE
jgi:hypothetical protein